MAGLATLVEIMPTGTSVAGASDLDRRRKKSSSRGGLLLFVLALTSGLGYIVFHVAKDLNTVAVPSVWPYLLLGLALLIEMCIRDRCTIFVQSHVKQHYELPLLLGMITPLGWLERVPSYKEMQENLAHKDLTTYGFLGYPVLMASDILLYRPEFVPVGQDQQAHVELTREVARRFNQFYKLDGKDVLPEPQVLLTPSPKLPGTDGRKMSRCV